MSSNNEDYWGYFFWTKNEIFTVPEAEDAIGASVVLGFRKQLFGFELGFSYSYMTTFYLKETAIEEEISSTFITTSLIGKYYIFPQSKFQVSIYAGGEIAFYLSDDCSETVADPVQFGDATYSGYLITTGIGFEYRLSPRLSINLDSGIHFLTLKTASGVLEKSVDIPDNLNITCFDIKAGLTYTFF